MGVGRRFKKQGPPATLEELGLNLKRKPNSETSQEPVKKRRRSGETDVKKLVRLDRALRGDQESGDIQESKKSDGKKQKQKKKLVNKDAQITVPPKFPFLAVESQDDEQAEEVEEHNDNDGNAAFGVPLDEASLSDLDDDEIAQAELEGGSSDDSVFDSDPDEQPRRMFSEDEDESDAEAQLTAANIEGLSRKLDQEQAQVEAEAQQELEDAALQTNIAKDEGVLDSVAAQGLAPDLAVVRTRMTETIRVLGNFSALADKTKSRTDYTEQLLSDICTYYGYTPYLAEKLFALFTPAEAFAFFEANETPRPVVLRTNTLRTNRRTLAQALINRGVVLEPVGKWSKVGLQVFESPVPLGATPEYLAGHYILQAASSFLPVMALAPQPNERVLDMAAAPGGKTTYISALMRNTGAVFANDANRQRAKGLIGNVHRLGCKNVVVCNYDAQKAFPKILGGFDRILLDAPCSGTGVIGKDPSVKTSKNERDFLALPHMQKQLLLAAIDSVDHKSKTGGYIVYSTCSVTVEENEGVVQYVLRKRPNVKIVDTGLGNFGSEGFKTYMNKKFDDKMPLTRRYFPHRENVDGFFVCKLKKTGPTPKNAGQANGSGEAEANTSMVNGHKDKSDTDGETAEDAADDGFGGFDDEEDQKYIAQAEKKWLKARGLDPKAADRKNRTETKDASQSKSGSKKKAGGKKHGK
ncbi:ribosomal RNA small subunit methyltransferase B [Exophiala oligosperma]|uniref:Nucleolar protein 2 n=1 Tax=Exophiala oligosperma TaxID=215243 RepID=A0A0D2DTM2_9EURO|nr:ribosomal RNA small subunit methyltransferase B [Exophiala oligosperma]KIW45880.1 ribosomal RNA small subunit methyltransferase B [Exophiala oligosperma]